VKLFRVPRTKLHVEMRTRDEHCPPHVHVENEEIPWEARLGFSFVSDLVDLMDIDPIRGAPGTRTIDAIKSAIHANLPVCRATWWITVGTCCLDNRWVHISRSGTLTLLRGRTPDAIQIRTTAFDPQGAMVTLIAKDLTTLRIQAGTGMEQTQR
jgi:hypothetical protein